MENKIKKVFAKENDYLIVVRENGVEKYFNTATIQEKTDLIVDELVEDNNLEEKDYLQLIDNGIIVPLKEDEDLIEEIIYYNDNSKFIVKYYSGEEKVINSKDYQTEEEFENAYNEFIIDTCSYYGISESKLNELGIIAYKKPKKTFGEVVETLKIKNLKINKKIVAFTIAGIILVLGGRGLYKLGQKSNNNDNNVKNNYEDDIDNYEETFDSYDGYTEEIDQISTHVIPASTPLPPMAFEFEDEFQTNYPIETPEPTPIIIEEPEDVSDVHQNPTSLDEQVNKYANDESVVIISVSQNEVIPYTYNNGEFGLDTLINVGSEGMQNLANHLQNNENPLNNYAMLTYPEKYFENPYDRAYVNYFANFMREITYAAYIDGDIELAKEYIGYYNYYTISCIRDGNPIQAEIDGKMVYISFDDLSFEAKETVLNLAWTMCLPLNNNFEYGQETISKEEFSNVIIEAYNDLSKTY